MMVGKRTNPTKIPIFANEEGEPHNASNRPEGNNTTTTRWIPRISKKTAGGLVFASFVVILNLFENNDLSKYAKTSIFYAQDTVQQMVNSSHALTRLGNEDFDYQGTNTKRIVSSASSSWSQFFRIQTNQDPQPLRRHTTLPTISKRIPIEDTYGQIINGRLVVQTNHTHLFWNDGMSKFCNILRTITNVTTLGKDLPNYLSNNVTPTISLLLSSSTSSSSSSSTSVSLPLPLPLPMPMQKPLIQMTADCWDLRNWALGQGNWVTAIYCVRLAAALGQVDFEFQCTDGRQRQLELLLPWFDGTFIPPSHTVMSDWPFTSDTPPNEDDVCSGRYQRIRLEKLAHVIQDDIRKMAVTLVGTRDTIRRHQSIAPETPPLIPNVKLDDVVIHFRCGDVMGGARRHDFGMIKFRAYRDYISLEAKTVGIVTQPFLKELNRGHDREKVDACKKATFLLVDYLQAMLPNATITIHNNEHETLPLAYARLAMANQSFTSLSSFGIFPIIGTFGHGYFQKGNGGVNPFATHIPQYLPNVHQMEAPVLTTWNIYKMPLNETLAWFVSDS